MAKGNGFKILGYFACVSWSSLRRVSAIIGAFEKKSETIRWLFIDRSTSGKNFTRIEQVLKILDLEDAEAHEIPREVSNRRVGS